MIDWPVSIQFAAVGSAAYCLGCVNAAFYVVRAARGADIRDLGSGNAGATNAGRVLGPPGFALVFALDAAKGVLAIWLARWIDAPVAVRAVAMFAVVLGHIWPLQLRGRGGKGIATLIGAVPAAAPWLSMHLLGPTLLALACTRRLHWAGVTAMVCWLPLCWWLGESAAITIAGVGAAALVLWAHRRDLQPTLRRWRRGSVPTDAPPRGAAGPT
ncbi:MAG: glycerol-3-phosphate acyltransferase [Gemmatimonadaceae bacterium]|nr:glycerol-3-phosphate acyltransferase [Gemmatimonadaceae bacterium]